jgi:nitrite reductase/ring-hydroxylating ferredoxin subunit
MHRSKFSVEDGTVVEWATLPSGAGETLDAIRAQHTLKSFQTRVDNGDIFLEWPGDNVAAIQIKLDFKLIK